MSTFAGQIPSGAIDGTNTVFAMTVIPYSVEVYVNGVLQNPSVDFTVTGSTITFGAAATPQTGDLLQVWPFQQ